MKKLITYVSDDGKKFDTETECLNYEEKRNREHLAIVQEAAKNIGDELWNEYFPNATEVNEPQLFQAFMWLENDLSAIVLRSEAKPTLDVLVKRIKDSECGEEILSRLNIEVVKRDIEIRSDWADALRNVEKGKDLSADIAWAFCPNDISELAKLHKANRFRKKIESLLTDCNFHTECCDFSEKKYEQYIK